MDGLSDKTYRLEPVGFINDSQKQGTAYYLMFGNMTQNNTFSLMASINTSSKDMAVRGFKYYSSPKDEIPQTIVLIEFNSGVYQDIALMNSDTPYEDYSLFQELRDKNLSFESEQFKRLCSNEAQKEIDFIFSTDDYDSQLISDVISSLNIGNTRIETCIGNDKNYYSEILLDPNKVCAFTPNNHNI